MMKTIALPALPGWPILPNLSENYLQCSLPELEEVEFDSLDLADMNETTHDGNWDKSRLSCLEVFAPNRPARCCSYSTFTPEF